MATYTIAKNPNRPPSPGSAMPPMGVPSTAPRSASVLPGGPGLLPTPPPSAALLPTPGPLPISLGAPMGALHHHTMQPLPQQPPQPQDEGHLQQQQHQIDPFLLQALGQPKDRLTILKLDYEFEKFMNSKRTRLDLPAMSSYQRLIVHRVAQHFRLHHTVVDPDPTQIGGQKRAIILFKTMESRIPVIRFLDLLEEEQEPPPQQVKIMKRQSKPETTETTKTEDVSDTANQEGSLSRENVPLEVREEAYLRARARIFNEEPNKEQESNTSQDNHANDGSMKRSPSTDFERSNETDDRELEQREQEKREKIERELERWRANIRSAAPVVSPTPSAAPSAIQQLWASNDGALEADHGNGVGAVRVLEDSEDFCITGGFGNSHLAQAPIDSRNGRRPGSSKKPGRNRSPSPVKSGGYGQPEALAPYPGVYTPSGRGRGSVDPNMGQLPFIPGFLRGPSILQGAPFTLAEAPNPSYSSPFGSSAQNAPAGPYYPGAGSYGPSLSNQHRQYASTGGASAPLLSDYPPYGLLPHSSLGQPPYPTAVGAGKAPSHLPLAIPPIGVLPHKHAHFGRGEYDRPPPKSTELFDPKASGSTSSSTSASTGHMMNHSLFASGPSSMPSRSYSATRAASGLVPPPMYPTYPPTHRDISVPSPAYDETGLSGSMSNMRINPQSQPLWGDHSFIYSSAPIGHQPPYPNPTRSSIGGAGRLGGSFGSVGGGRGGNFTSELGSGGSATGRTASPTATTTYSAAVGTKPAATSTGNGAIGGASLSTESASGTNGENGGAVEPTRQTQAQPQQPRVVSFPHILEVVVTSSSSSSSSDDERSNSAEVADITETLKKAGANVKFLGTSILAIFKTGNAATKALEDHLDSPHFKLRPWVAPLSPGSTIAPTSAQERGPSLLSRTESSSSSPPPQGTSLS